MGHIPNGPDLARVQARLWPIPACARNQTAPLDLWLIWVHHALAREQEARGQIWRTEDPPAVLPRPCGGVGRSLIDSAQQQVDAHLIHRVRQNAGRLPVAPVPRQQLRSYVRPAPSNTRH